MPWFRSPSGHLTHAVGGLAAACTAHGYVVVPDDDAIAEATAGVTLHVTHEPHGEVDQAAIEQAVKDEGPRPKPRPRSRKPPS